MNDSRSTIAAMMDKVTHGSSFFEGSLEERMAFIVETMREMSRIDDPQVLVKTYGARMRQIIPVDASVSLSRRGLGSPQYRITRSSRWERDFDPWKQGDRLQVYDRGILGKLIYGDEPVILDDFEVSSDDPAAEFVAGMKSLMALPLYEQGEAINMVVLMSKTRGGFEAERMPMQVWMGNLFGRATRTLVLSNELQVASAAMERELKAVADIQRSLLPTNLPEIDGLELAVHYQTSRHSGGDYYDFFKLPDNKWGILIADVSGHGTPAAVLMAITHSIAHIACDPPVPPGRLLDAINNRLAQTYTGNSGHFVTAFYGVYDPADQSLLWSNAGHPPPRIRRADGTVGALPMARSLPLGIEAGEQFGEYLTPLAVGDMLLFYTDGITEARSGSGDLFDPERLDAILHAAPATAEAAVKATLEAVAVFSGGRPLTDDRTLLAARVVGR